MTAILDSLARALRDLFSLRVLWVVIWPMLVAMLLWMTLGITFWSTFSGWLEYGLDKIGIQVWLSELEPVWIANGIQALLHLMLFVPLVMLTALVLTALFAMPTLIRVVAERDYPQLKRENGGGLVGSVWNAVIAIIVFIALWVVSLPLWLIGVGILIPFVAAAYLNQRLFRYDAIAEHATANEMTALFKSERGGWWGLGLLTGLIQFVPVLNLFGPVLAALAFIHYGLARLNQQRRLNDPQQTAA
ncbi:MAG: EI24 domain-containing protein [Thiobacillus sp.]